MSKNIGKYMDEIALSLIVDLSGDTLMQSCLFIGAKVQSASESSSKSLA
ncbi:hypothetical protein BH10PLA2_BH10PLA2_23330 [soil metagenome]